MILMSEPEISTLVMILVRAIKKLEKPIQYPLWIFMTSDLKQGVLSEAFSSETEIGKLNSISS
ncbi:MAG: hypothetical protein KAJ91_03315 [Candidatus Aenigmarchaeota archaeon]|nr:hypothetical protein [Candidatus Aenigmarchaeota archaeon]MCK5333080.1 hypothetical protein [Candidatus Aenigmarchaeota archaeon]